MDDGLAEHGRGRRPVASDIVRLRGDLLRELCADVLKWVLEIDILSDRNAIVGDGGRAELLVQHYVTALGPKCDLYRVCQGVYTCHERMSGILVKEKLLRHIHHLFSRISTLFERVPSLVVPERDGRSKMRG